MGYIIFSLVLVFAVVTMGRKTPKIAPSITWPTEYHYKAEDIDLVAGIVKQVEVWNSVKYNRSRISIGDGNNQRFFYTSMKGDEDMLFEDCDTYLLHPETDENDNPVIKCKKLPSWLGDDQADFLPDIFDFEFKGYEEHEGKEVSVWVQTHDEEFEEMQGEETLYVYEKDEEVGVPVKHITKVYGTTANLKEHRIVNYYSFNDEIDEDDLEIDVVLGRHLDCEEWDPFADFEKTMKPLHPDFPHDVHIAFESYKKQHKRDYADEEHEYRKAIFHMNWKMIHHHNSKNLGYKLALNKFADKTSHELRYLSATRSSGPIRGTHEFPHSEKEVNDIVKDLPAHFDLRSDGLITPVRNQAECGSCWAFAAAATVEGALARSNGGRLIDLSEQSLVDCAWQYHSKGCEGTDAIDAVYQYIIKYGIPTVQEYGPYLEEDGLCRLKNMSNIYHIKGFAIVTPESPKAVKTSLYLYGPLNVGVHVTSHMRFYSSGVYYDMDCKKGRINHAVTLVGYGIKDDEPYWIVKNSWGEEWGSDGYLYISAKQDNCNIMEDPVYVIV